MPGVIVDVRVVAGERVRAGHTMLVMEGMKMEHHLNAPFDGVVADVLVRPGDQVDNGAALLVFEASEASVSSSDDSGERSREQTAHG